MGRENVYFTKTAVNPEMQHVVKVVGEAERGK